MGMDYGPDWPPAPQPPKPVRRDHPLWHKVIARVVLFAVIWGVGAIALHILVPTGTDLNFPTGAGEGHTTNVTSSLPPHPAR